MATCQEMGRSGASKTFCCTVHIQTQKVGEQTANIMLVVRSVQGKASALRKHADKSGNRAKPMNECMWATLFAHCMLVLSQGVHESACAQEVM